MINAHGWPQLQPFHWNRESGELRRIECLASGVVVVLGFHAADDGLSVEMINGVWTYEQFRWAMPT